MCRRCGLSPPNLRIAWNVQRMRNPAANLGDNSLLLKLITYTNGRARNGASRAWHPNMRRGYEQMLCPLTSNAAAADRTIRPPLLHPCPQVPCQQLAIRLVGPPCPCLATKLFKKAWPGVSGKGRRRCSGLSEDASLDAPVISWAS